MLVEPGVNACISESDITVNDTAGVEPKSTAVALLNPEPVMMTRVPPLGDPSHGAIDVTETGVVPRISER